MDNISPLELERILTDRIELIKKDRSLVREQIDDYDIKIKNLRKLQEKSNLPKEKDEELVILLNKLEHQHATTPQNNFDEREFMREKEKLRQKRKNINSFMKIQSDIDILRIKLNEFRKQQSELDDSLNELSAGLRRIKVVNIAGCQTHEVIEKKFIIDFQRVGSIVGRGGGNLRAIEFEFKVSVELDNHDGAVRIMGTERAIDGAFAAILRIIETCVEKFHLSDEAIVCLLMEKAQLVNEMQSKFNVQLDLSRAKNMCKITGLTGNVLATKTEILSLQSVRTDILIESADLPVVFGKGGANITAWQEEFRVSINVNRDRNAIEIVGLKSAVSSAIICIKDVIDANKEVEEIIKMEKYVLLGCLIGTGGQVVRAVSKEYGVRIDTKGNREEKLQTIRIKGTVVKVAAAKEHILHLVNEFVSSTQMYKVAPVHHEDAGKGESQLQKQPITGKETLEGIFTGALLIELPNIVFSAMIGKNGSNISKMEEELQVKFDAVRSTFKLRIRSDSPEKILAAKTAVNIFIQNTRVTDNIELTTPLSATEIDAVVKECCELFNVEVLIATKNQQIKIFTIKGVYMLLIDSIQYLRDELSDQPCIYSIPIYTPPHSTTTASRIPSHVMKHLQKSYVNLISFEIKEIEATDVSNENNNYNNNNVSINVVLRLTGQSKIIKEEKLKIFKILENTFTSELLCIIEVPVSYLRDAFDGKIYTEIHSKMVYITIDRILGFIAIFGLVSDISDIKYIINQHLQDWKACNVFIPVDKSLMPLIVGKKGVSINALRKEIKVSLDVSPIGSGLEIKGNDKILVEEARICIEKKVRQLQSEQFEIDAPVDFLPILIGKQGVTINKLRIETETSIDLDENKIRIRGKPEKVIISKNIILEMIDNYHLQSSGFKSITIPINCIPVLYGPKGNTIREIQLNNGVKLEMDREVGKLAIRGSVEGVEKALQAIELLLSNAGISLYEPHPSKTTTVEEVTETITANNNSADDTSHESNQVSGSDSNQESMDTTNKSKPKLLPGASPAVLQKLSEMSLSKSALKRLRKKQSVTSTTSELEIIDEPNEAENNNEESTIKNIDIIPSDIVTTTDSTATISHPHIAATSFNQADSTSQDNTIINAVQPATYPPALGIIGRANSNSVVDILQQPSYAPLSSSSLNTNPSAHIYDILSSSYPQQQNTSTNSFSSSKVNDLSTDNLLNMLLGKSFDGIPNANSSYQQPGLFHSHTMNNNNNNTSDLTSNDNRFKDLSSLHNNNSTTNSSSYFNSNSNILNSDSIYNDNFHSGNNSSISTNSYMGGLLSRSTPSTVATPPPPLPPGITSTIQHRPIELHIQTITATSAGSSYVHHHAPALHSTSFLATTGGAPTPPPPGLSPTYFTPTAGPPINTTGSTTASTGSGNKDHNNKFSFLDYSSNNPDLSTTSNSTQNYLSSNDLTSILSRTSTYNNSALSSNNTLLHPSNMDTMNPSINNNNHTSSSQHEYYKSKSGLSVRL